VSQFLHDFMQYQGLLEELETLKNAGIYVIPVALSSNAPENTVRAISPFPQLANATYFLSPRIADLDSLYSPLAAQVCYPRICMAHRKRIFSHDHWLTRNSSVMELI